MDNCRTKAPIRVPCGDCIGCRLEYSRQWGIRCHHEAQLHNQNCFVTLTYNDDNLPSDLSVNKEEIQKFVRRLRKRVGELRYYACGEYGNNLGRPHYHLCIFGFDFEDKEIWKKATYQETSFGAYVPKKGTNDLYRSALLEKVWQKGFSTVGSLTFESACYAARYCCKKINGPREEKWYKGKQPEFALMSRRPGIAQEWIKKYMYDVYPKDSFTLNGKHMRSLRYYDKVFKRHCADLGEWSDWEKLIERRAKNCKLDTHDRLHRRAKHKELTTKPLVRKMEEL